MQFTVNDKENGTAAIFSRNHIPYIHETPHSPDIAPCDSFLFSQIINIFKGKWFQDTEMTMLNATQQLSEIPKRLYERCWNKCIQAATLKGD